MELTSVFQRLKETGVAGVVELSAPGTAEAPGAGDLAILVEAAALQKVLEALKEDEELLFDQLSLISGVPYDDRFECVYHLLSTVLKHSAVLRVVLDKNDPAVPTASLVHLTAGWHERETYDLVGIRFEGHPDLRRIYLPDGWIGHPLRRDYKYPREFQGVLLYDAKRAEWDKDGVPPTMADLQDAARNEKKGGA